MSNRKEKPEAWDKESKITPESESRLVDNLLDYSYEDFSLVINRLSFVFFLVFNTVFPIVVLITVEIGGQAQV